MNPISWPETKGSLSSMQLRLIEESKIHCAREHFKAIILKAGGKVSDSVSNKTTYLLAGENAGSKLQKAQKLNVTILTEKEFNTLMGS